MSSHTDSFEAHKSLISRNIIHRDVCPNNILLSVDPKEDYNGVLIDFHEAFKTTELDFKTLIDHNRVIPLLVEYTTT